MTINPRIGFIAHFPLNAAIKGGDVDWALIPVDLTIGRDLADRLTYLRTANGADAFGDVIDAPIAVPSTPSPDVEREPEGDGGLPSPSEARRASAAAAAEVASLTSVSGTVTGDRRHFLLQRHTALTDTDKAAFKALNVDRDDLDAIEAALDGLTRHRATAAAATLPTVADEGDPIDAGLVAAIGARYADLPDAARSWVTACGAEIRLSGSTGVASVRRFEALRGLLILATDGFDDDNTVRAIAWHIFGDVVHFANVRPARIIGALGVDEAKRFALMADALAAGRGSMRFTSDARCFIDGLGDLAA